MKRGPCLCAIVETMRTNAFVGAAVSPDVVLGTAPTADFVSKRFADITHHLHDTRISTVGVKLEDEVLDGGAIRDLVGAVASHGVAYPLPRSHVAARGCSVCCVVAHSCPSGCDRSLSSAATATALATTLLLVTNPKTLATQLWPQRWPQVLL